LSELLDNDTESKANGDASWGSPYTGKFLNTTGGAASKASTSTLTKSTVSVQPKEVNTRKIQVSQELKEQRIPIADIEKMM
jgi:hypothetical protein